MRWDVLLALASLARPALAVTAKSYTGWDCCKPICAETANRRALLDTRGVAQVCDKNNRPILDRDAGIRATTGCAASGGSAFLCDSYQPIPVSDTLTYGFAIMVSDNQNADNANCCKCQRVTWTTGGAVGKTMIVQIVTPGGSGDPVKRGDLIFLIPGGGLGPLSAGCTNQYGGGFSWGENKGGVKNREACEKIPGNLMGGCYWRFNWARGEINGWDINYEQVECPSILTDISGCAA